MVRCVVPCVATGPGPLGPGAPPHACHALVSIAEDVRMKVVVVMFNVVKIHAVFVSWCKTEH